MHRARTLTVGHERWLDEDLDDPSVASLGGGAVCALSRGRSVRAGSIRRGGIPTGAIGLTLSSALLAAVLVVGVLVGSSPASYGAVPVGFVHRSGKQLLDGQNKPIKLDGVNLGQWLNWEVREMGVAYSETRETDLLTRLSGLVGNAQALQFQNQVRDSYVTLADFQAIAARGLNVVRVPFNHTLLEDDSAPGKYKDSGWARFDAMLSWAEQTGVYVVLDMHAAPCGQSTWSISDPDPVFLWDSPSCQQRTKDLWQAIAARYAGRTIIAGYDLLNEPFQVGDGSQLVALQKDITTAIRTVDKNHLVILEGAWGTTNLTMFTNRFDDNSAYSMHQYLWATWDATGDTDRAKQIAARDDMPLWVGEFGQDVAPNIAKQVERFNQDPALSGWSVWTWKTALGQTTDAYNGVKVAPNWSKLIKYMDNPSNPKPTPAETTSALSDYLTNIKLANTTLNARYAEALAPKWSTIKSAVAPTKCVDDVGAWTNNGNGIVLYDCLGTLGQAWSRNIGTPTALMTLGKCLAVQGGNSVNGAKIVLWDCDGTASQQWTINSDGTIRALGKCLDLPGGWAYNYNGLQLYQCNGGTGQRWIIS